MLMDSYLFLLIKVLNITIMEAQATVSSQDSRKLCTVYIKE